MPQSHHRSTVPAMPTQRRFSALPRASALALACSAVLAFSAQAQQAQSADAGKAPAQETAKTLDKVEVIGIRRSIATSVETKNEATSIVEAVSAEDIGKLPDISIADSISRLPGLTMQRVDGRGQVIHIRGMSEQFAGTLLNGREQVSTGDSRGVEFDQYPAELINAVTVYKTPDASLIGQGLSGTVDMQTVRPLDFKERKIVVGAQGERNSFGKLTDGGKHTGYRLSASYIDQFANDTIGLAIGAARLNAPFQEKHYKSWWWANTSLWGAPQGAKPDDAIALQGAEAWVKSRDATRDGVMAVLEFKPNDTWHSVLDAYHSKFDQSEWMRGAMWTNDPWWNNGAVTYTSANTTNYNGTPVVTSGTLSGIRPVVRNDNNLRNDTLSAFGWNTEYKTGPFTVTADLSYSRAEREQSMLETYAGMTTGLNVDFRIPLSAGYAWYGLPDLSAPASVKLGDPQGWGHDGRLEDSRQVDTLKAFRLSLNHALDSSFLSSYDIGYNFSRRSKDKHADVYFADLPGRTPVAVDPSLLQSPTDLGFAGMGSVLTFDPRALLSRYYNVHLSETNDDLQKDYRIEEDIGTFYAKANIDTTLGERVNLRGNVGFQYIHTNQKSNGVGITPTGPAAVSGVGASYNDFLPSINLVFDFNNGWNLRVGAAKEQMRPRINDMGAYANVGVSVGNGVAQWSGSGGNPRLEPFRAKAFDISVEKYFGPASYVALAAFYKDLESYVYTSTIPWDFSGYEFDTPTPPQSNIGTFSAPANGQGGYMRGVEFSTSLGGELLHPALEGFGLLLNGSYTESSIDPDGPGGSSTDTIPGLSKIVANATVFYEKNGFSARVSERFRDPYRGEYSYIFGQRSYRYTRSERTIDMQVGYDFPQTSRLHGLSLLLQVNNLNNEPFTTQVSDSNGLGLMFPEEYTEYGRQYLLGVRYSF
ncbi:TonB-dependent receptor [Thermomonas hydrothermalis]|uniref:Iron complex outermembrane recepter protein n=1 Tax=Thermomonas hydrothermalis TaxID=213588 RepID=A0A1M4TL51_9GAMM|nr:TonB-dependent receptor [Thermomonas hydrothermalis]SHE45126.1 iron complex outermembrane recepter protein [Thermomonas hydrothermalis]